MRAYRTSSWFVIAVLFSFATAASAKADGVYTYSGNRFTSGDGSFDQTDYLIDGVMGRFTTATVISSNQTNITIDPLTYFFTAGPDTIETEDVPTIADFVVSTGPTGSITAWNVLLVLSNLSESYLIASCNNAPTIFTSGSNGTCAAIEPTMDGGYDYTAPACGDSCITGNGVNQDNPGIFSTSADLSLSGGLASAPQGICNPGPPLECPLVGEIDSTIAGSGSEDFYSFFWAGGSFSATASITGSPNSGASYLFSEGVAGTCSSDGTATLSGSDSFAGTIEIANLAAGRYCIGLDADNSNDPAFSLIFNTPVTGQTTTPEPSGFVLLSIGLGMVTVIRLAGRLRINRRRGTIDVVNPLNRTTARRTLDA